MRDLKSLGKTKYYLNDATAADLDGDGQYEVIIKRMNRDWATTNTNYTYFEAYKLDGTFMWAIDIGPNITMDVEINIAAFDFDGDGKAEVFMRSSDGTIFGLDKNNQNGTSIGDRDGDGVTNYRGQTVGMFSGVWVCGVFFIVGTVLGTNVFGYDFLGTVGYNSLGLNLDAGAQATPVVPWVTLLAGILGGSPVLTVIMSVGFIAWIWLWIPAMQSYGERAMIAWAFDRVAPNKLGTVSDRFHSPVVAIGVATIITAIFMYLFVYVSYFGTLVLFLLVGVVAWTIALGAGAVFPFKRPEIYGKSSIANKKVLGLPIMTVGCLLGFIAGVGYSINMYLDEFAVNARGTRLLVAAGVFASGLLFFYVMKLYRRSQGVDINLAFKEIPIE